MPGIARLEFHSLWRTTMQYQPVWLSILTAGTSGDAIVAFVSQRASTCVDLCPVLSVLSVVFRLPDARVFTLSRLFSVQRPQRVRREVEHHTAVARLSLLFTSRDRVEPSRHHGCKCCT